MPAPIAETAAVVSRTPLGADAPALYLQMMADGVERWTCDPGAATPFGSMRDAIRAAMRQPAPMRAFGLPLRTEVAATSGLH